VLSPRFAKYLSTKAYENGDRFHFYLSGPMTGLPDYNRPAFDEVAKNLREKGFAVFSPSEIGPRDQVMSRSWYMRKDIQALLQCDAVMMLPDWEQSEGARLEFEIAKQLELPIKFVKDNPKGEV
jgi:hypothetical protein